MEDVSEKIKNILKEDYKLIGNKNIEVYKERYISYLCGLKTDAGVGEIDVQNKILYLYGREYIADASKIMRKLNEAGLELKLHIFKD